MRKPLIILSVLCILLIVGYISVRIYFRNSNVAFIKQVTHITLPRGTSTEKICDNAETAINAIFILPVSETGNFITTDSLKQVGGHIFLREDDIENWVTSMFRNLDSADLPKLINKGGFYCRIGHSNWQTWVILLNSTTGKLWVDVEYPDPGGTKPPPLPAPIKDSGVIISK